MGEVNLMHEALDLHQLSQDVLNMIDLRASEAGITLEYERSMDEVKYPYVYGSALHLQQIFLNIYSNSIKYNTLGGRITDENALCSHGKWHCNIPVDNL